MGEGGGGGDKIYDLGGSWKNVGQTLMEAILSCGVNRTVNTIWDYSDKGRKSGVDPTAYYMDNGKVFGNTGLIFPDGLLPH